MDTVPHRILLIIDCLGSGGAQRQLVNLAVGLAKKSYKVHIFLYKPNDQFFLNEIEQQDIQVHRYKKKYRFSFSVLSALRRLIQRENPDIVLSFLDTANFYAEIAKLGIKTGKLIVSERSSYFPREKIPLRKRFLDPFHRFADHVVVNSFYQSGNMVVMYPWMKNMISVRYNGISEDMFRTQRGNENRSKVDRLQLLAIGTNIYYKNAINLVKALSIYRNKYGPPPIVRWVGKDDLSKEGKKYTQRVFSELEQTGTRHHWEWFGEQRDITSLLQDADALIHPSLFEGLPNVVCEALSSGLPVLVSRVCEHPRIVQEGQTGFLFNPDDPEDIANTIHKFVLLSSQEKSEMGRQARLFAKKNFKMDQFISGFERLFAKLFEENSLSQ